MRIEKKRDEDGSLNIDVYVTRIEICLTFVVVVLGIIVGVLY